MESWKVYFLSIFICVFVCGILQKIIVDTKGKKIMQLLNGVVLVISALYPLTGTHWEDYFQIPDLEWEESDCYIFEGEKAASEARKRYIQDHCEAYILDRARDLDSEISVCILLNDLMVPDFSEIRWDGDPNIQIELENILTTDLGIPKENQQWIWNQENNSS